MRKENPPNYREQMRQEYPVVLKLGFGYLLGIDLKPRVPRAEMDLGEFIRTAGFELNLCWGRG